MVSLVQAMNAAPGVEPVLVLSNRPDAAGLRKAHDLGVVTAVVDHTEFKNRDAFEAELNRALDRFDPDIICLAGFMRILGARFIDRWAGQVLNIHPSLLPKYKGLNTHARALDAGDTVAGCSVHEVTLDLDEGPILGQATVPIRKGDTAEDLAARVLVMEHQLYPAVLLNFARGEKSPVVLSA